MGTRLDQLFRFGVITWPPGNLPRLHDLFL